MVDSDVRERVALLVAENALSDAAIARRCGINRRTLARWKSHPEFQVRVKRHLGIQREQCRSEGITDIRNRIKPLDELWQGFNQIITERSASPEMQRVPGGTTGLLRPPVKVIRADGRPAVVADYRVDEKLLQTLRELEVRASKELGQWGQPLMPAAQESIPAHTLTGLGSGRRHRVALLIAQNRLGAAQIANSCQINRRTLNRWKNQVGFQELIADYRRLLQHECEVFYQIASKEHRLRAMNQRWEALEQVMNDRGEDPELQEVPGGRTGLIVRSLSGSGRSVFITFLTDVALLRESRKLEAQAAQELKQC